MGLSPDRLAEAVAEALEPDEARLVVFLQVVDRAAAVDQLFGGHRGVADDQQAGLRLALQQLGQRQRVPALLPDLGSRLRKEA